jgi:hypothetical protein
MIVIFPICDTYQDELKSQHFTKKSNDEKQVHACPSKWMNSDMIESRKRMSFLGKNHRLDSAKLHMAVQQL